LVYLVDCNCLPYLYSKMNWPRASSVPKALADSMDGEYQTTDNAMEMRII